MWQVTVRDRRYGSSTREPTVYRAETDIDAVRNAKRQERLSAKEAANLLKWHHEEVDYFVYTLDEEPEVSDA